MKNILIPWILTVFSVQTHAQFEYLRSPVRDTSVYTRFSLLNGYLNLWSPSGSKPLADKKLEAIAQEKSLHVQLQDGLQISSRLCLAIYCVNGDFPDDPVEVWNRIFLFGADPNDILFESGSFSIKQKSMYFLKMKSIASQDGYPYYRLLFFTSLDGKLLYGSVNGYQMSYGEWNKEVEDILTSIEISDGLK